MRVGSMTRGVAGPATVTRVCRRGGCVAPFSQRALLLLLAATTPHCALPRSPAAEHLSRSWISSVRRLAGIPEVGPPSCHTASSEKAALGGVSMLVTLRGGSEGLHLEDEDEELLPEMNAVGLGEGGEWKWQIPHGGEETPVLRAWGDQEDYSAETSRTCMNDRINCKDALVVQVCQRALPSLSTATVPHDTLYTTPWTVLPGRSTEGRGVRRWRNGINPRVRHSCATPPPETRPAGPGSATLSHRM